MTICLDVMPEDMRGDKSGALSLQPAKQQVIEDVSRNALYFLSLFFGNSFFFTLFQGFPCFFDRFSFFSRDFRGSAGIKKSLFFWWFSLPFSKKNKERKDRALALVALLSKGGTVSQGQCLSMSRAKEW